MKYSAVNKRKIHSPVVYLEVEENCIAFLKCPSNCYSDGSVFGPNRCH